jgi:general secretion pathway protein K
MRTERGFILIYVVVMVAALAVLLAAMQRIRPPSSEGIERQLGRALQSVESRAVLDYTLSGLRADKHAADPRYEAYQRVFRDKQGALAATDDRVAFLRELLRSMNFELDIQESKTEMPAADDISPLMQKKRRLAEAERKKKESAARAHPFHARKETFSLTLGDTRYGIDIHPANALPNLNRLPAEPLIRYLKYLKLPEAQAKRLAGAIIDWRDSDDSTSDDGAEADHYLGQQPGYRPRNAPIKTWQELAYLREMSPDILQLLRENFTLDGPGTAALSDYLPKPALAALADLPEATIAIALEHQQHAGTGEERVELREILLDRDARAFQEIATNNSYTVVVRILIAGPQYIRTIRYDIAKKKILDEW